MRAEQTTHAAPSTSHRSAEYRKEQKGGQAVGLYKICEHDGRARDRCDHAWWGSFRGVRVSLAKWTNREIDSKAKAAEALDDLRRAVRNGTFDERDSSHRARSRR